MSNTKKALRYFAKYLKPYWKGITIVVILSLISSGAQVMAPTYLGRSVTALTTYLVDLKKGTASMNTFYSALWSMFLFYLLSQIAIFIAWMVRSEEHTSELQSRFDLVCRLLLEKKKMDKMIAFGEIP